jgi:tripartite-type tricarboxylate transporter receptor subunit TctC
MSFFRAILLCALALAGTAPGLAVAADAYPTKPIRFIAPYGPGGSSDFLARMIADHLSRELGQPIVVENKPGASGMLGTDFVAKSAPDGYTMLMGFAAEIAIAPGLFPKVPYDPTRDLIPVTVAAMYPLVLVTTPRLQLNTVDDIVAQARASGGKIAYASSGAGSPAHIAFELLAKRKGITMTHVPYKGGGQALTDVLGGHTPMFFSSVAPVVGNIKANQLKAVVVSTARRSPTLPDVPGMAEAGVNDYDLDTWNGVFVPAGTPPAIVARLNAEITKIMQRPDVAKRLADAGAHFTPRSTAEATKFIHDEIGKYRQIVRELGIKGE